MVPAFMAAVIRSADVGPDGSAVPGSALESGAEPPGDGSPLGGAGLLAPGTAADPLGLGEGDAPQATEPSASKAMRARSRDAALIVMVRDYRSVAR
jgi:hypothetical protein